MLSGNQPCLYQSQIDHSLDPKEFGLNPHLIRKWMSLTDYLRKEQGLAKLLKAKNLEKRIEGEGLASVPFQAWNPRCLSWRSSLRVKDFNELVFKASKPKG